jgi:hypothetical protein
MAIAAYLGDGDRFDRAVADFAKTCADQAERDYALLTKAIKQGKVKVEAGVQDEPRPTHKARLRGLACERR